jgi:hypothetical protein
VESKPANIFSIVPVESVIMPAFEAVILSETETVWMVKIVKPFCALIDLKGQSMAVHFVDAGTELPLSKQYYECL